jgi:hypothetical protein
MHCSFFHVFSLLHLPWWGKSTPIFLLQSKINKHISNHFIFQYFQVIKCICIISYGNVKIVKTIENRNVCRPILAKAFQYTSSSIVYTRLFAMVNFFLCIYLFTKRVRKESAHVF